MPSCPPAAIRDALGRPREGVHAWRVPLAPGLDVAGVDLLATAGLAAAITGGLAARRRVRGPAPLALAYLAVLVILLVVAVGLHRAFCVNTALNVRLGLAVPAAGPGA
jgi:hypothetical protein